MPINQGSQESKAFSEKLKDLQVSRTCLRKHSLALKANRSALIMFRIIIPQLPRGMISSYWREIHS